MKSYLRYMWRQSLAGELWRVLTPLGRVLLWVPALVVIYPYMLLFAVVKLIDTAQYALSDWFYSHPETRRKFLK